MGAICSDVGPLCEVTSGVNTDLRRCSSSSGDQGLRAPSHASRASGTELTLRSQSEKFPPYGPKIRGQAGAATRFRYMFESLAAPPYWTSECPATRAASCLPLSPPFWSWRLHGEDPLPAFLRCGSILRTRSSRRCRYSSDARQAERPDRDALPT